VFLPIIGASLNFKLKVYITATALGVLLLIFNISVVSVPAMKEKNHM
jgi:hypothetical protein